VSDRSEALLAWYRAGHRRFPWRDTQDPYRILVSEVMLQQTQASRVVPAYLRFLERFPTAEALAEADLGEVLAAWQGLGYPRRAARLRAAAARVAEQGWPTTSSALRDLPGVGPYTAAAVAAFAFGERVAALDTNARRVLSRWHGEPLSGGSLLRAADAEVPEDAATWNQAVMELGATTCRPRNPQCSDCPVASWCADPSVYEPPPRQAPYDGSMRQVRGDVLRLVTTDGPAGSDVLAARSGHTVDRIADAIESLRRDGLVAVGTDHLVSPAS
jgi:A/G-specific adenine glycosylase